jgi:hypothetical protein
LVTDNDRVNKIKELRKVEGDGISDNNNNSDGNNNERSCELALPSLYSSSSPENYVFFEACVPTPNDSIISFYCIYLFWFLFFSFVIVVRPHIFTFSSSFFSFFS